MFGQILRRSGKWPASQLAALPAAQMSAQLAAQLDAQLAARLTAELPASRKNGEGITECNTGAASSAFRLAFSSASETASSAVQLCGELLAIHASPPQAARHSLLAGMIQVARLPPLGSDSRGY